MDRNPDTVDLDRLRPFYTGSVQRLYELPDHPDMLVSETTSGGSVFDVGTIFSIEESDTGRASFRHLVFQRLNSAEAWDEIAPQISITGIDPSGTAGEILSAYREHGASTHHIGMIDRVSGRVYRNGFPHNPSNLTLVRKFSVLKPETRNVMGRHFFDYEKYHHSDRNVVPLEYIVRLGITSGSSILRKYNRLGEADRASYLKELGVESLTPWSTFETPVVDLTTKYEPEDRNTSLQEASCISGLDGTAFSKTIAMAMLGAFMVREIFNKMGLCLWDLKWEIARDGDDLVFVDTIDTDSVRVTYNLEREGRRYFVHFNKQSMRDYYRIMHADWYAAVNEAKKIAAGSGRPFTEILAEGQAKKEYPQNPVIEERFLEIQKRKFRMIQDFVADQSIDSGKPAETIAIEELKFYEDAGKLSDYEALNSVL
jgi:phosphoribosylaminoimidazole-succinocarboxamide synthase